MNSNAMGMGRSILWLAALLSVAACGSSHGGVHDDAGPDTDATDATGDVTGDVSAEG